MLLLMLGAILESVVAYPRSLWRASGDRIPSSHPRLSRSRLLMGMSTPTTSFIRLPSGNLSRKHGEVSATADRMVGTVGQDVPNALVLNGLDTHCRSLVPSATATQLYAGIRPRQSDNFIRRQGKKCHHQPNPTVFIGARTAMSQG